MNWLTKAIDNTTSFNQTDDLQELMIDLIRFGKPRVSFLQGGWYCTVEMNTNTTGAKFDISSEFNHPTPMSAAKQCYARIQTALKQLTNG